MGTLITGLVILYFLGKAFYRWQQKLKTEPETEASGIPRDALERKIRQFIGDEDSEEDEADNESHKHDAIPEKPHPISHKKSARMESYAHPEFEGTARVSTVMKLEESPEEDALRIQILEDETRAVTRDFLPKKERAKRELLRKGIVLKEILETKYF